MRSGTLDTIFLAAAAIAVLGSYLVFAYQDPVLLRLPVDAKVYLGSAEDIAKGNLFGPPPFRPPGYPYLLAVFVRLFGTGVDLLFVRVFQVLVGTASILLVRLIGEAAFGRFAGNAAALLLVGYWPFVFFHGELLSEAAFILLVMAAVALAFSSGGLAGRPTALLSVGALFALAVLFRANGVFLVPLFLYALWPRQPSAGAIGRRLGLFFGVFCLILVLNGLRNLAGSWGFVPVSSQSGINFTMGNRVGASGYAPLLPGLPSGWDFDDLRRFTEARTRRPMAASEVASYWNHEAFDLVREHPLWLLRILGKKTVLFMNGFEIPDNRELYQFRRSNPVLRVLPFGFPVLLGLAAVGCLFGPWADRRFRSLVFGACLMSLGPILFFVTSRLRLPAVPFLALLGGLGCLVLRRSLIEKKRLGRVFAPACLAAVVLLSSLPVFGLRPAVFAHERDYTLALIAQERGDAAGAEGHYRNALALFPEHAESHRNLGLLLLGKGRYQEALEQFDLLGTIWFADRSEVGTLRATALLKAGRHAEALAVLEDGRGSYEGSLEASALRVVALFLEGRVTEAAGVLQAGARTWGRPFLERIAQHPDRGQLGRIREVIVAEPALPPELRQDLLRVFTRYF